MIRYSLVDDTIVLWKDSVAALRDSEPSVCVASGQSTLPSISLALTTPRGYAASLQAVVLTILPRNPPSRYPRGEPSYNNLSSQ